MDEDVLYKHEFVQDLSKPDTYGMQQELRKFAFRTHIEKKQQLVGATDVNETEVMDEDMMISNPVINTNDTIEGIDNSRFFKEIRTVVNVNSVQRELFQQELVPKDPVSGEYVFTDPVTGVSEEITPANIGEFNAKYNSLLIPNGTTNPFFFINDELFFFDF